MNSRTLGKVVLIVGATAALGLAVLSQREGIADLMSWEKVSAGTEQYKEKYEPEFIFEGWLERQEETVTVWIHPDGTTAVIQKGEGQPIPNTRAVGFYWNYLLTRQDGSKIPVVSSSVLKRYVDRYVEIRGKEVVPESTGVKLEGYLEIWPGKIREAQDSSKPLGYSTSYFFLQPS